MIRVLVTGANGQLGKSIAKMAAKYPEIAFSFKDATVLDITNPISVQDAFRTGSFNFCINCAAYTHVEQAEKDPEIAFLINAEGVKNVSMACKTNSVVLIHISTDYVFDGEKRTPYTINDLPNPINEYGKSKLKGEQYVKRLLQKYHIIRTSWLYSEFGNNFYKTIIEKAKTEKILYVTDEQIGCPTNAHNLAQHILGIVMDNNENYGIHHFTDDEPMTWYGFAEKILRENGFKEKVRLEKPKNYRTFAARPSYSVLN
ncbi:dTDP-4-dehydrorhamnose reductase [Spongiimicrobium sp. 3-5]|uniref:dTDP-4-dehydrorhamnose reductase n=1 Tax=Spongiimicrobium sp. 3-5 TaxID=3332596 RepID=UPI0039814F16